MSRNTFAGLVCCLSLLLASSRLLAQGVEAPQQKSHAAASMAAAAPSGLSAAELNAWRFRQIVEGSSVGRALVFDRYAAPDCIYYGPGSHEPVRGTAALNAMVVNWRKSFPDLQTRVIDIVASGDIVMTRVMASGTLMGEFMGQPGTGKYAEWEIRAWARFKDGLMVEDRTIFDRLALFEQLGITARP